MSIVIKNLSHSYKSLGLSETMALNNASLTIHEGEFVGIIGHTGSGKTTFVQHLNGLLKPGSGSIEIDGIPIDGNKKNILQIRRKLGLVFQYPENQLFEETIYKDIAFGPKNLGLKDEELDKCVREAMDLVSLDFDRFANESPFEISGGQMRRVAIAGVIAMNPKYLVLDEPTAGLDPHGRDRILSMIYRLHKEKNITVIMITHNMDDIAKYASRVLVFNAGSIIMDTSPKEAFCKEKELNEIGLGVPQSARLAHLLHDNGMDIDYSCYKMEDLREQLLKVFSSKEGKC